MDEIVFTNKKKEDVKEELESKFFLKKNLNIDMLRANKYYHFDAII